MRRRPTPEDIISTIFIDEGFYEVGRNHESIVVDGQLILSNGKQEIVINILSEDSCSSKSTVHEVLIEAERMIGRYDGVVLAIPRKYLKVVDEGVLARHGIGLVIYDMMGAEELLPPRINYKKQKIEGEKPNHNDLSLSEIALIRSEISKIAKILEEFEARLDRLEREQKMINSRISEIERMRLSTEISKKLVEESKTSTPTNELDDKLPYFLRDNPWVEILSKRM